MRALVASCVAFFAFAAAASAVEFGWQPLPEGGIEYLVRIEPGLLDSFREISSDIPSGTPEIRRIKVVVSVDELLNEGTFPPPSAAKQPQSPAAEATQSPAIASPGKFACGWQELSDGGIEYAVRVEPELLSSFHEAMISISKSTREIRRVRLVVSEEALPNEGVLLPSSTAGEPPPPKPDPMESASNGAKTTDSTSANQPANFEQPPNARPIPAYSGPFTLSKRDRDPPTEEDPSKQDAKKPEINDADAAIGNTRPWLPLMAALVGLFASLGANAYLVWIHQSLRANYRTLAARMRGEPVTL